jgi:general stress protein 26
MQDHPADAAAAPGHASASSPVEQVAAILVDHHLMSLATLRPDGWPQVTIVNYLADGLALYCLVARDSQKLANIIRDPRVSIAIGAEAGGAAKGLSMAAVVTEVDAGQHVEALNRRIWMRTETEPFTPHPASHDVAVLRATPRFISLIDYDHPPGRAALYAVAQDWRLSPVAST